MPANTIKVLIADDHPFLRAGICNLLSKSPHIVIVGEASNGIEAIELMEKLHPDVLLLDVQMPVMDGIQVLEELNQKGNKTPILMLSAFDNQDFVNETISRGAWGYYLKEDAPNVIIEAIHQAAIGMGKGVSPVTTRKGIVKY